MPRASEKAFGRFAGARAAQFEAVRVQQLKYGAIACRRSVQMKTARRAG